MAQTWHDQLGPQVFNAAKLPCPCGVQPSRGQLLQQQACDLQAVYPVLVLGPDVRCLVQHTLERLLFSVFT